MKPTEKSSMKRMYINPTIEFILIDNEISLAMQSEPPAGPEEFIFDAGNSGII